MIQELLEYIITPILTNPEALTVTERSQDGALRFTINVADEDRGKVIGKDGQTIRALRTLVHAIEHEKQVFVEIAE